ncbi:LexA family protein [Candidatus Arthromitus sp. SFB-mouse]|uniref:LexA family protein n=2 Tax=Candidatus Arthromitus sp. SFB-mouse TaxID=49118 RepID=UPI002417C2DA|nr:S24 family peptidase [Candidatus Arthromitus sp. SFB-mouse]
MKGDSMSPTMDENDIVIVKKQNDISSGDIAIVCINGDEATCKKIIKHKDGISLVSLNSKYEPMYYDKNDIADKPIHIIGKVVELRRRF